MHALQGTRLEARQYLEHLSSMHWHTSMLVQSIMHTAMESTSSAYTCAILNVLRHRSFVHTHADMRAILKTCRAVQLRHACSVRFKLRCTVFIINSDKGQPKKSNYRQSLYTTE